MPFYDMICSACTDFHEVLMPLFGFLEFILISILAVPIDLFVPPKFLPDSLREMFVISFLLNLTQNTFLAYVCTTTPPPKYCTIRIRVSCEQYV